MGDTLQFIRYAPLLKQRGANVVARMQNALLPLLASCAGIDRLMSRDEPSPDFDVQAPLLSVPGLYGTEVATIPAETPYLTPRADLVEQWAARLAPFREFKIGVAWQGNPKFGHDKLRSIPVARFEPLAALPGVRLFSLQKGFGSEQLREVGDRVPVVDWTTNVDEGPGAFMDTAALMQNLDLVITSDTAVAHLAGALAVPVWLALPFAADWRWLERREDSPWYPSMRLFRQSERRSWEEVFERIAHALRERVPTRVGTRAPIMAEIAVGELIDKITILEIKAARMTDEEKLAHVRSELETLKSTRNRTTPPSGELTRLTAALQAINESLWDVEDEIRRCDGHGEFGARFVELAQQVYRTNDRRAEVKRQINTALGSRLVEEKQYAPLVAAPPLGGPRTATTSRKRCRHGEMLFPTHDEYIGRSLAVYGEYSEGELRLFEQCVRPGQTALDVGANIGAHTISLARLVGLSGTVLAFEPQRFLFQCLNANLGLNEIANVRAEHAALGQTTGTINVPNIDYGQAENFGGVSLSVNVLEHDGHEAVRLEVIDGLDLSACDFIKIDVEGMECDVLRGAARTIRRFQPILYVEDDRPSKSAELCDLLHSLGYDLWQHWPPLFNAANFAQNSENVFGNVVSLNLLCLPQRMALPVPAAEFGLRRVEQASTTQTSCTNRSAEI